MHDYGLPALYALFVWWFSTGVVIYLDGLPQRTFRWSMLGATALLGLSLYGLAAERRRHQHRRAPTSPSPAGSWPGAGRRSASTWASSPARGTGPAREGCSGWRHFGHAIQTSLWHELAIIAASLAVVAITWGQPNQIGTWTFMVLWWMHQSAKLNVFLGVRNLNEEFLPEHLAFLKSFLTKKPMNLLFPVSVTVSTVIAVLLFRAALAGDGEPVRGGRLHLPRHADGARDPGALVPGGAAPGRRLVELGPQVPGAEFRRSTPRSWRASWAPGRRPSCAGCSPRPTRT